MGCLQKHPSNFYAPVTQGQTGHLEWGRHVGHIATPPELIIKKEDKYTVYKWPILFGGLKLDWSSGVNVCGGQTEIIIISDNNCFFSLPVAAIIKYFSWHLRSQVELILRAAVGKCHDRLFIMTPVVSGTFIYCSKWWTNAQIVPRGRVIKMSFWRSVSGTLQGVELSRCLSYPPRQVDRLWLVTQQVLRLGNVCWHGEQLSRLKQLLLMKHKITVS